MIEFHPLWYTIPNFADLRPIPLYHKENKPGPAESSKIKNLHVLARNTLEGYDGNDKIMLRITADDYYKLYVNGRFAGQGPAPSYPEHYYYNVIDLTPFLHEGRNTLAVHLYYQGLINRVWNSGDNRFGLACDIISHGESKELPIWKYQISHAFSGDTVGYETQFLENFDGRKWEEEWNTEKYNDSDWKPMVCAPWADYTLSEQPSKMLKVSIQKPKLVQKKGNTWFVDVGQEIAGALKLKASGRTPEAAPVLSGDPAAAPGLLGDSADVASPSRIIIQSGEECKEDGNVRYDMRCGCRYEEVWTLKEGENCLEPYDYKGFRYAQLICENGAQLEDVEVLVRHYPMNDALCTLKSSSSYLDQIFTLCKNSVKFGTQEGYIDCPTREKGQYLGDAIITAHSQVWLTGSVEMLRKCLEQFLFTTRICPGLMSVAPGALMQEIADFSLLWTQLLMIDYRFTKDKELLRTYYPAAKQTIEYFKGYAREDGMLEQVSEKWNLVDWPENLRDGYDFELSRPVVAPGCHNVINALYAGAVQTLSGIEEILGLPVSYDWKILKQSYINTFYCQQSGWFRDSESSSHTSLHSNVYALYFGLCPEKSEQGIADFLVEKGFSCGVFISYFYLEALARAGRFDDVYKMLVNQSQNSWINMLKGGATTCWEVWDKNEKWNTSLCHPWASAPIPLIIERIAGFMPAPEKEEGFYFDPHIPEDVKTFRMQIPFLGKEYVIEKINGEACLRLLDD